MGLSVAVSVNGVEVYKEGEIEVLKQKATSEGAKTVLFFRRLAEIKVGSSHGCHLTRCCERTDCWRCLIRF